MIIAIAAAHAMEFSTFRRYMGRVQKLPLGEWQHYIWLHEGNQVILLETGIGPEKAAGACEILFETYPVDCMINFGSAGMINGDYQVGDAFLADETIHAVHGTSLGTDRIITDSIAAFLDESARVYHRGRLLTSPEPVVKCSYRTRYAHHFKVGAVDMEAFALNQCAVARGIPFASLKMISDRANALTRLEFWKNLPHVDRTLGKLMYGFLGYFKNAA
jgi:adenosylhomocysteine nucleosidase